MRYAMVSPVHRTDHLPVGGMQNALRSTWSQMYRAISSCLSRQEYVFCFLPSLFKSRYRSAV